MKIIKIFVKLLELTLYFWSIKIEEDRIEELNITAKKYQLYYNNAIRWIDKIQNQQTLQKFLNDHNIKNIALYGAGTMCDILLNELTKMRDVTVSCIIETSKKSEYFGAEKIPIISVDELKKYDKYLDVIIVTPIYDYNNIFPVIREKNKNIKIISLVNIVENYQKGEG